jgi:hypothetical protein
MMSKSAVGGVRAPLWEDVQDSDTIANPSNMARISEKVHIEYLQESKDSSAHDGSPVSRLDFGSAIASAAEAAISGPHSDLWVFAGVDAKSRVKQWSPLHCCILGMAALSVLKNLGKSSTRHLCAKRAFGRAQASTIIKMANIVSAAPNNFVEESADNMRKNLKGFSHAKGPVKRLKNTKSIQSVTKSIESLQKGVHSDVLTALLQAGAFVNNRDALGRTPLMLAASCNLVDAIGILIKAGADLSAVDDINGNSPLHYAYASGSMAAASLLEELGAPSDLQNQQGKIPLDVTGLMSTIGYSILD